MSGGQSWLEGTDDAPSIEYSPELSQASGTGTLMNSLETG